MNELKIANTKQFDRDKKKAKERGLDLEELAYVVELLKKRITLPPKYHDHAMKGMRGLRNCHIRPDWVLFYRYSADNTRLHLERTSTHSDLKI